MANFNAELQRCKVDLAVQKAYLEDAKGNDRVPILKEIKRLEVTVKLLEEGANALAEKMAKREQNASRFGLESVDMEMLRGQIRTIDQVLTNFVTEKERLGAEICTPPRVTLLERAE